MTAAPWACLLIVAGPALPLAMAAACLAPAIRARALGWLWVAPVPAALAAAFGREGGLVIAPAPLRLTLALDAAGAMLLGGAAILWAAAGLYAASALRGRQGAGRFALWWLLALGGSLGTFVVADLASFYLAFSVASLAAYGLVTFEATPEATRAGRLYMILALLGEAFLLLGLVMVARGVPVGNPLIREAVAAMATAPGAGPALLFLVLGFALKMGLVPLHVWMPVAHPVAPAPASAALSGIIVKAGVIGLIRFLPLESGPAAWGDALAAVGLITAFYGACVGASQRHPKIVLAYSTVSQMGLVAAILGAGMSSGTVAAAPLAAFYALHHMLVKGALFLGIGLAGQAGARGRVGLTLAMGVLALSLAGLPLTSGALAKHAVKPLFGDGLAANLATLSAAASTVLMLRFLTLPWPSPDSPAAAPRAAAALAWSAVAAASFVLPWLLFPGTAASSVTDPLDGKALWTALWPILLGALSAFALFRLLRIPEAPQGDILALVERAAPLLSAACTAIENSEAGLRRWTVACATLVALAMAVASLL